MTQLLTVCLTQGQIDFHRRQGYLVLPPLTTPDELAWLREIYDRLFSARTGREEGNQFDLGGTDEEGRQALLPQILSVAKYAPQIKETLLMANARSVVRQLLGPDALCEDGHAIYKPPRIGAQTPWHQDAAYWSPDYDHYSLSLWIPLQEATLENGCMHFVPGSHRDRNILPHRSINNDPRIHGLELVPEAMEHVRDSVACPLPPGGATIHGGYTLHYAGANRSDIPRRALILIGSIPATRRATPRSLPWQAEKRTARMERVKVKN